MNFVDAYNFFFPPQIAIRRYTGTNSSSHAKKNNRKSWERKTNACADACTNKRAKYRLDFFLIFQLAAADKNVINPLNATKGADNPSTPRDHSKPIEGNQEVLSTSCKELTEGLIANVKPRNFTQNKIPFGVARNIVRKIRNDYA